jgi:hypothetical protein
MSHTPDTSGPRALAAETALASSPLSAWDGRWPAGRSGGRRPGPSVVASISDLRRNDPCYKNHYWRSIRQFLRQRPPHAG